MSSLNEKNILEILDDLKANKKVNWRLRRLVTLRLASSYKRLASPKYNRIIQCGGCLEFRRYADNSMKLHSAKFCQLRLCPMCNFRRGKKLFAQISKIMKLIENDFAFLFLTLTVKNVKGCDLENQIDRMVKAFKLLCLRKQFKESIVGWAKCFEVTYNWDSAEYHPHYHVLLVVDKNYFKSDKYINQKDWCLLWQSCLGVDYKPIVDIRVFTDSEKGKGKEVAEVAKYTVKSSNIMANLQYTKAYSESIQAEIKRFTDSVTDEIVSTLDSALHKRRLIEFGGIVKQKHKELNLDDSDGDNADLVHIETDCKQNDSDYTVERYGWSSNLRNYVRLR